MNIKDTDFDKIVELVRSKNGNLTDGHAPNTLSAHVKISHLAEMSFSGGHPAVEIVGLVDKEICSINRIVVKNGIPVLTTISLGVLSHTELDINERVDIFNKNQRQNIAFISKVTAI